MNHTVEPIYRIDRFRVPDASLAEFVGLVRETHSILRTQNGFVRDYLVAQPNEDGHQTVLTFVEWLDEATYAEAVGVVKRFRQASRVDMQVTIKRLEIEADLGTFHPIPKENV